MADGRHARQLAVGGGGPLARTALRLTAVTEKWLPDAFGFVLVGTFVALLTGVLTGEPLLRRGDDPGLIDAWGHGFRSSFGFTAEVAMIVVAGHAVATSGPVALLITRLAKVPETPRVALPFVATVAMLASYLNWVLSLVLGAILAREVARNLPRADYRALGAMAFLGVGTAWIAGGVPFTDTDATRQGLVASLVVLGIAAAMAWLVAPGELESRTASDSGLELRPLVGRGSAYNGERREVERPGDRLEHSPVLTLLIVALGAVYLLRDFRLELALLLLAALLHWRPWRTARAFRDGAPAAAGVLLLFPLYGGILGMTGQAATVVVPFWMAPALAILGLKVRDVLGYVLVVFLACVPAALLAIMLLA